MSGDRTSPEKSLSTGLASLQSTQPQSRNDIREPAATHLRKAEEHLEQAKSQYESAKAVYQSARATFEAVEVAQAAFDSSGSMGALCDTCAAIPLKTIFKPERSGKPQRRRVGDLFQAVERQSWCSLCKFLLEAFQLGDETQSERLPAGLTSRDTAIYFADDRDGLPWYNRAGLNTNVPPCPFVWLQTGQPTLTGQPHICLSFEPSADFGKGPERLSGYAYPRRYDPLEAFNGALSYETILSWLAKCEAQHRPKCIQDHEADLEELNLSLIDVKTRCVVTRQPGDRYVALSYVWGKGTENRLGATGGSRTGEGGPSNGQIKDRLPKQLPQTMEDAITFTSRLGEKFLWVDLFCIDQTSQAEMRKHLDAMDQIFASAYVTLVSLDGENADWGLPGVSRSLIQVNQPTMSLGAGRLMATFMFSVWDNLGASIWDSRAWTLQERLLSPRCILFAKSYIAMNCREEMFHHSMDLGTYDRSWLGDDYYREDGSGICLDKPEWVFETYDSLLSVYSGRNLTFESDALNACQGSLNKITQSTGVKFCFGLPENDIYRALLWKPHHDHVCDRRSGFPSWSWLGWKGRIESAYWIDDMRSHIGGTDGSYGTSDPPLKRKRASHHATWHPRRATIEYIPRKTEPPATLRLRTPVATFKLRLLRRHGSPHKHLPYGSLQTRTAVGDHWTLLDAEGEPLRQQAGEHQVFEPTDVFFRVDPKHSKVLEAQGAQAKVVFVHEWSKIRDSHESNKWLFDMVSALLIIDNADRTAWRLAPILLEKEQWLNANPTMETVTLV